MSLTTREEKGEKLTIQEMDGNLTYLESLARPYKVYTALLTQSGGNNPQPLNSGNLTIGVTYLINADPALYGSDFTMVGAPNNNIGTYFVATGITPNWGINPDPDMLFYNTGAPVVTVLENTIGNIYFTYYDTGDYLANLLNGFPYDKTTVFIQGQNFIQVANNLDYIEIVTNSVDSQLSYTPIEIRVYN
jgi:hypothetical protein